MMALQLQSQLADQVTPLMAIIDPAAAAASKVTPLREQATGGKRGREEDDDGEAERILLEAETSRAQATQDRLEAVLAQLAAAQAAAAAAAAEAGRAKADLARMHTAHDRGQRALLDQQATVLALGKELTLVRGHLAATESQNDAFREQVAAATAAGGLFKGHTAAHWHEQFRKQQIGHIMRFKGQSSYRPNAGATLRQEAWEAPPVPPRPSGLIAPPVGHGRGANNGRAGGGLAAAARARGLAAPAAAAASPAVVEI